MLDAHTAFDAHRPALVAHCYRMLGSPVDAEDAVQEALIRALRGASGFEERASVRTWLHRIATNVCLDELKRRKRRRELPTAQPAGEPDDPIAFTAAEEWLEPFPDAWALGPATTPEEALAIRQSLRLAFVAALQHLPAKQRAALLLTQVAGMSAEEAAETLDTTKASIHSALQRARSTLAHAEAPSGPLDAQHEQAVARYVAAFEAWDVDALVHTLTDDIAFCMPPIPLWLDAPDKVYRFLHGPGSGCVGSRLVPVQACGQTAFAQYKADGSAWGLVLLDTRHGKVSGIATFLATEHLFPLFDLPLQLDASPVV